MNPSSPPRSGEPAVAPRVILSAELLGQGGRILIEHQGEHYLLRITRQGKLILTKY